MARYELWDTATESLVGEADELDAIAELNTEYAPDTETLVILAVDGDERTVVE